MPLFQVARNDPARGHLPHLYDHSTFAAELHEGARVGLREHLELVVELAGRLERHRGRTHARGVELAVRNQILETVDGMPSWAGELPGTKATSFIIPTVPISTGVPGNLDVHSGGCGAVEIYFNQKLAVSACMHWPAL
jgi:hypothetical protein